MIITVIEIVINIYGQTTVSSRFAYIFWSMFGLIYAYTGYYERFHNKQVKKSRKFVKWNFPFTLYILGAAAIATHHLTIHFNTDRPLPGSASGWGIAGFFIAGVGFSLVCIGRASLDGYWAANIHRYGEHDKLITDGLYRFTRHPIYDGQFLMTLGTVFLANNLYLAFFPALTLLANLMRARREDQDLLERFPDAFVGFREQKPFFLFVI